MMIDPREDWTRVDDGDEIVKIFYTLNGKEDSAWVYLTDLDTDSELREGIVDVIRMMDRKEVAPADIVIDPDYDFSWRDAEPVTVSWQDFYLRRPHRAIRDRRGKPSWERLLRS